MPDAASSRVIVMGCSAGGVDAMLKLATGLPATFEAPILVVQHIGANRSYLPELLNRKRPNLAKFGEHGEIPEPSTIHVAPSDHHMLLEDGRIRLSKGPKEQHTRPAINPLFRSAALAYGTRAIGVVLTGMLDDGTAGLQAIKACGGVAVVQDPADALEPSMPLSALAYVAVDHIATLDRLPQLLCDLAARPREKIGSAEPSMALRGEHAVSFGDAGMDELKAIGALSAFTCPDCGGALFELNDKRPVRFVCHTGHSYSLRTLAYMQEQVTDSALWRGLRVLQEKEAILRRLAESQLAEGIEGDPPARKEADDLASVVGVLRRIVEHTPTSASFNRGPDAGRSI